MNLSDSFIQGFSRGMGAAFVCMVLVFLVMCTNGCDRTPKAPDPAMVNRALVWGEMRGREVAFFAQEMTMLHPNSERSQSARRKLIELDDVLRGKNSVEEGEEE